MDVLSRHIAPGFLHQLDQHDLLELKKIANTRNYKKNSFVFQAAQTNNTIYIVEKGRVKLFRISEIGREFIQWIFTNGDIFGLSQNRKPEHNLYAQALSECTVLSIKRKDFNRFITDKPYLALPLLELLSSRISTLGDTLLNVTSDDARIRFEKLLRMLAQNYGQALENEIYIDVKLTHQEMADMIGLCRQSISTLINRFKRQGIITTSKQGITIKLPDLLGL